MPPTRSFRPIRGFTIRPFDAAGGTARFLVETPAGRRWQVNGCTVDILRALADCESPDAAAAVLTSRWRRRVTADDLPRLVERTLLPIGLVVRDGAEPAPSARAFAGRLAYMSVRFRLLSRAMVESVARPFRPLFRPAVFWPASLALAAVYPWLLLSHQLVRGGAFWDRFALTPSVILLGFAGMIVHEIGHAGAAQALGVRHGALGFGVYFVFPMFFMELDEVWRLPRAQRALADVAGLFLQGWFVAALMGAGLWYVPLRDTAFSLGVLNVTLTCYNLNPVFRTDGYWLLSDLLGVPNLRAQSLLVLRRLVSRGRVTGGASALPNAGALPPASALALGVYSLASVVILVYAFAAFVRQYVDRVGEFPTHMIHQTALVMQSLRAHEPLSASALTLRMLGPTALIVGGAVSLVMIALQGWRVTAGLRRRGGSRIQDAAKLLHMPN